MAKVTAQIQFASNVQELKAQIAGGTGSIIAMKDAVDRAARSLGGEGLLRAAHNTTAAVQQLGGATKLTAAEKEKINTQLTKAIEKYQLLGREAPAAMVALQKETTQQTGLFDKMKNMLGPLGSALAAIFAIGAIVGAGKKVLDFAGDISDLAGKLGMSTTAVQKFKLAFEPAGVSIETVGRSAQELANRIIGGDKSAAASLQKLGLNAEQLKGMSMENMFITVADAVGGMGNQAEKIYASKTLFGKGGTEMLAALDGKLAETTKRFEDMGLIISEDTIAAGDKFGDQLGMMGQQLMGVVAQIVGPLLPALSAFATVLGSVGGVVGDVAGFIVNWLVKGLTAAYSATARFVAGLAEMAQKIPFVGQHLTGLAGASEWLRSSADAADAQLVKMFTSTTNVGQTATVAAPPLLGLGGAADAAGAAAEKAADKWTKFNMSVQEASFSVRRLTMDVNAVPPAIQSMNTANSEAATILQSTALGAYELSHGLLELPPAIHSMAVSAEAGAAAVSKSFGSVFADLPNVIMAAFTGGGDVGKSIGGSIGGKLFAEDGPLGSLFKKGGDFIGKLAGGGIGKMLGSSLGSMMGPLGTMLGGMAGDLIGPLISKVGGFFKSLFGGPSGIEVQGRQAAATFRAEIASMLNPLQRAEAGADEWKLSVIGVRDAFIAAGRTEQEALAIMDRLWRAEKQGGDAVAQVIREIQEVIQSGLTPAAQTFGDTFGDASVRAQNDMLVLGGIVGGVKSELAKPVVIPITYTMSGVPFHSLGTDAKALKEQAEARSMSDEQKRDMIRGFLERDPNDQHRIPSALGISAEEANRLGFQGGTRGQFIDFGAGTDVTLHGRERVVTEAEGRSDARALSRLADRLDAMMARQGRESRRMEEAIMRAFTYGPAYARAR